MGGRSAEGDYARFVEATLSLADAAAELPRRSRLDVAMTILRVCESEQLARAALFDRSTQRLEVATSRVQTARERLADLAVDARRRRLLRAA